MLIIYSIDYIKTEDIGPYKICLQKFYRGSFARYRVLVTDIFCNNNASGFYESIKDAELRFDKFVEDTKNMLNSDNKNFILDNHATALTTNDELLFHFTAVPGINSYDIDYYTCDGKKIDALGMANIEASKICGAGNEDVDNAIYYVISSKIYDAMIETLPISILFKVCYGVNDAHKKNPNAPTAKEYIKELFNDGAIDRFLAEFMMSLIGKDGNIRT